MFHRSKELQNLDANNPDRIMKGTTPVGPTRFMA